MGNIGLKYFWKNNKGYSAKLIMRNFRRELRYAIKRFWYGHDDVDVFDVSTRFRDRMIDVLQAFLKHHLGLFWVPRESEYYETLGHLDEVSGLRVFNNEETDLIIETMIYHLKMMDSDYVEKKLYGANAGDEDYDPRSRTGDDWRIINTVVKQNKACFMKLFDLFFWDLWD